MAWLGQRQSTHGAFIFYWLYGHGYAWLFRLYLLFVVLFHVAGCIVDPVALRDEVLFERGFRLLAVLACLNYVATDALNYTKAPGPSGDRGEWPWRALRWCAPRWPGCTSFSSGPCTVRGPGAAGHNRWGVAETPLPVKTQGRTRAAAFNVSVF